MQRHHFDIVPVGPVEQIGALPSVGDGGSVSVEQNPLYGASVLDVADVGQVSRALAISRYGQRSNAPIRVIVSPLAARRLTSET